MLPLPLEEEEIMSMVCCGKRICDGCNYKHWISEDEQKCAFCCQPMIQNKKNRKKAVLKLMKKNHPNAFFRMAYLYKKGDGVLQSNTRALEMYIRALLNLVILMHSRLLDTFMKKDL